MHDESSKIGEYRQNLRILFPRHKEQMYSWMNVKNKAFENRSPVEVVKEFGLEGLIRVNSYLYAA